MLSIVCSSHEKAEAAVRVDGEEGRALLEGDGGLWLVFVGVLFSSAVTIHGESTFLLLLKSQDSSSWKEP